MKTSIKLFLLTALALLISNSLAGCSSENYRIQLGTQIKIPMIPVPLAGIGLKPIEPIKPGIGSIGGISFPDYVGKQGWARSWGGSDAAVWSQEVAVDNSGNIYVAGWFEGESVDFSAGRNDPLYNFSSNGSQDAFLCKFSPDGDFQWARTWGGTGIDGASGIAVTGDGFIYVVGSFEDYVDFHPSSSRVDQHYVTGGFGGYISKFDTDGHFQWANTWGPVDYALAVATDGSGYAYVLGTSSGPVDLNPSGSVKLHEETDSNYTYISKFAPTGYFQWAKSNLSGRGLDIDIDSAGNLYIVGSDGNETYLYKLSSSANIVWLRTWGRTSEDIFFGINDKATAIAVAPSNSGVYITGWFSNTVNFSSGQSQLGGQRTSIGKADGYVSKFDASGAYQWVHTFGGQDEDYCKDVAVSGLGHVYITGYFGGSVDFNAGGDSDSRTSNGQSDVFLSRLDPGGNYKWTQTWGGKSYDLGSSIFTDTFGGIYVTGVFTGVVNFATSGVSFHTAGETTHTFLCTLPPTGEWGTPASSFDLKPGHSIPGLRPIKP